MARFSKSPFVLLLSFVLLHLTFLSSTPLVHAGDYSVQTPTGATRWVAGQLGLVTIVSKTKAKPNQSTNDELLTITLQKGDSGKLGFSSKVTTIRDRVQLLIPESSTQSFVTLDISDWVVPANVVPGTDYFVRVIPPGWAWLERTDSPTFQIVAAAPVGNTTSTMTMTMTNTITTATATTAAPTPTQTQTCSDIKEQCAAQGKTFVDATATSPCACGADIIIPSIVGKNGSGSIKTTVKNTFKDTGGPTAAFAVLILVVMTLF
ncbi:hypothetical protein BGX28_010489 [Mortierella sp. GBA30]|nr:hypothetical protein BGX28_010489 [Mortierella sp. GBA30]